MKYFLQVLYSEFPLLNLKRFLHFKGRDKRINLFMETTNYLTKIIAGIILVIVLAGIVFLFKFADQNFNILTMQNQQGQKAFSAKDYADSKGYKNYFEYQGEWYTNINGEWKKVKDYAAEKGYKDYFTSRGNWYINADGAWKSIKEFADSKGYKDSFLFHGIKFENTNGTWIRVATK